MQAEIDTARVEGEIVVDPVVYHALLFGLGFFYFLVSIVRRRGSPAPTPTAAQFTTLTGSLCARAPAPALSGHVTQVPGTFLTVLEALGFKADRDKGMLMLNTVYEHGGVRSPVAAMILLANYLFIPRALTNVKALLGRAGPICRDSMLKYPYGRDVAAPACGGRSALIRVRLRRPAYGLVTAWPVAAGAPSSS